MFVTEMTNSTLFIGTLIPKRTLNTVITDMIVTETNNTINTRAATA